MNKQEAIEQCKVEAEKYGDIFGDWNVILKDKTYQVVSSEYLKSYRHFGKIYHTEIATEPKDVEVADNVMKELLLTFCKTRRDRRSLERAMAKGGIREFFKKFKSRTK